MYGLRRQLTLFLLQVEFVHKKLPRSTNTRGPAEVRRLWAQLVHLPETKEFRNIFDSAMISMNIFAPQVDKESQASYARLVLVQDLSMEKTTKVRTVPDPWESVVDNAYVNR